MKEKQTGLANKRFIWLILFWITEMFESWLSEAQGYGIINKETELNNKLYSGKTDE